MSPTFFTALFGETQIDNFSHLNSSWGEFSHSPWERYHGSSAKTHWSSQVLSSLSGLGLHTLPETAPSAKNALTESWGDNTAMIHRRLVIQHNLRAGLFIFPFSKEYNLLEDLEGLYAAYWKENKTTSEVKSGRGKSGENSSNRHSPRSGIPQGEAFESLPTNKRLFLKPLNNQIPRFPLIYHSSVY